MPDDNTVVFEDFALTSRGDIALIELNRVEKHNSLTRAFWHELRSALTILERDETTRVVLITGAGEHAFSAGGDIPSIADLTTVAEKRQYQFDAMATFEAIQASPLPILAVVNGYAIGGGFELALACDAVIAADTAQFGLPEARIGLMPGFSCTRAAASIGSHWSKWLIYTGEMIDATTAERIGLVQRVVPLSELSTHAMKIAATIASHAPLAISTGKRLINSSVSLAAPSTSVEAITALHMTADTSEGVAAFVEGRAPLFEGR